MTERNCDKCGTTIHLTDGTFTTVRAEEYNRDNPDNLRRFSDSSILCQECGNKVMKAANMTFDNAKEQ